MPGSAHAGMAQLTSNNLPTLGPNRQLRETSLKSLPQFAQSSRKPTKTSQDCPPVAGIVPGWPRCRRGRPDLADVAENCEEFGAAPTFAIPPPYALHHPRFESLRPRKPTPRIIRKRCRPVGAKPLWTSASLRSKSWSNSSVFTTPKCRPPCFWGWPPPRSGTLSISNSRPPDCACRTPRRRPEGRRSQLWPNQGGTRNGPDRAGYGIPGLPGLLDMISWTPPPTWLQCGTQALRSSSVGHTGPTNPILPPRCLSVISHRNGRVSGLSTTRTNLIALINAGCAESLSSESVTRRSRAYAPGTYPRKKREESTSHNPSPVRATDAPSWTCHSHPHTTFAAPEGPHFK